MINVRRRVSKRCRRFPKNTTTRARHTPYHIRQTDAVVTTVVVMLYFPSLRNGSHLCSGGRLRLPA